ncbi:phosphate transport system permease protein [Kibdelosporangium banguiense]|uniref:Phosphate transport system permease protein PstA n=1 Tax=Kibdelosporangium banguiense TaxID=1365924 RepID=A0ABS4TAR7_9PSEU|nr:phosphate ABC transporter permease PstA [Kibdelosporangium banguiense]MBP2320936.1 phosphate transport system permease protein [Kibdelosporangium banguiense]
MAAPTIDPATADKAVQETVAMTVQIPEPVDDEPRKRDLRGRTLDDVAAALGSLVGALGLVWVLYENLLPTSGPLGFFVSWFFVFVLLYAGVTAMRHPRTVIADRVAAAVIQAFAGLVGLALLLVVGYTAFRGADALGYSNFFTTDLSGAGPLDPLTSGGVLHALVGTLVEIMIAIAITLPLGVGCAVYLNEVGGRFSRVVRTVVEAMTALPSIVAGLFIFTTVLLMAGLPRSGLAASLAISVMMLPIIARSAEVVLRVVPGGLREASLALGASQWQTVWRVVLPTARPSLATALILGIARGIGETSPVLLTAGYTTYLNFDPTSGPMVSLPLMTYQLSRSSEAVDQSRAFGAATILLLVVLLLFVIARLVAQRSKTGR